MAGILHLWLASASPEISPLLCFVKGYTLYAIAVSIAETSLFYLRDQWLVHRENDKDKTEIKVTWLQRH